MYSDDAACLAADRETSYTPIAEELQLSGLREQLVAGTSEVDAPLGHCRRTLLHMAVLSFRPDLVELLIEYGADPLQSDAQGQSPQQLAAELLDALYKSGDTIRAAPLAARLSESVSLLDFAVAQQRMWEEELFVPLSSHATPSSNDSMPPHPAPLTRTISNGRNIKKSSVSPLPPQMIRSVTVDGAAGTSGHSDLHKAAGLLDQRLRHGEQVFSDLGLLCLIQLHADAMPPELRPPTGGYISACREPSATQCSICLEHFDDVILAPCGMNSCTAGFCRVCLSEHARHSLGELRYAVPVVRCPACRNRIPAKIWEPLHGAVDVGQIDSTAMADEKSAPANITDTGTSEPSVYERIETAGKALLKVRCPGCHTTRDLFQYRPFNLSNAAAGDPFKLAEAWKGEEALRGVSGEQRLRVAQAAELFRRGGPAEALLDALFSEDIKKPGEIAEEPSKDVLSRYKFMLRLITDLERAIALQLGFYRRFPLIRTPCCNAKMCFKCKVTGHHPGQSCEERQRAECAIEAQFCPGCGVPTVKGDGCNSIICVCGASWSWRA